VQLSNTQTDGIDIVIDSFIHSFIFKKLIQTAGLLCVLAAAGRQTKVFIIHSACMPAWLTDE